MTATPLRNSLASWRTDAPWPKWTRGRTVTVWVLLGGPVLVATLALLFGFTVGMCSLHGMECSPEENRQLAVAVALYYGSLVAFFVATVVVFVLRRRFFWLMPGLLVASTLVSYLLPWLPARIHQPRLALDASWCCVRNGAVSIELHCHRIAAGCGSPEARTSVLV